MESVDLPGTAAEQEVVDSPADILTRRRIITASDPEPLADSASMDRREAFPRADGRASVADFTAAVASMAEAEDAVNLGGSGHAITFSEWRDCDASESVD